MAAGRLAGDRLAARYGPAGLVRRCGLLAAAGLAGALVSPPAGAAVIGFAACGGGLSCTVPQLFSAAGKADPDHPGGAMAQVARLGYLGLVGGPLLIGGCASLAGLTAALCIPAVLGLCVAGFAFLVRPAGQRAGARAQRNGSWPVGRITISLTSTPGAGAPRTCTAAGRRRPVPASGRSAAPG